MSTSPDTQKNENFFNQEDGSERFYRTINNPGLVLLKGLLGLALIVGIVVALGMNYEVVWAFLVGTIIPGIETLFEVAEKALDSFFLFVGMAGTLAPIATAYTGFVIALAILYLLSRKGYKFYKKTQLKKQEIENIYVTAWKQWSSTIQEKAKEKWNNWWDTLDNLNKVVAVVFMVLIGIPIALLLSFILGSLVAGLI